MRKINAPDRQRTVYLDGAAGKRQAIPFDPRRLEVLACQRMSPKAAAYVAGGAGMEHTQRANTEGFAKWRIVPRMFRNVEERSLETTLFGHTITAPMFLAPIGVLDMARPKGDAAAARAAAALGLPCIFSNQASAPMEYCAAEMGDSPRFFQLYWSRSEELVASFLHRAEAAGCSALVVTLDTTMLGWRTRDLELGSLPFLQGLGIAQYTSDPVFQKLMLEPQVPASRSKITLEALKTLLLANWRHPGSFWGNLRSGAGLRAVRTFIRLYSRPNITWADLPFLRKHTTLPLVLKGILHPDDARKALDYGVDGIYVSNHGGRQVDGAVSSIEALPGVVDAVRERIPVLIDSGFRSGVDVYKAVALGATAVGVGRPYCYALAIDGQAGVEALLANWIAELELTMGLSGCKNLTEVRAAGLLRAG